MQQLLRHPLTGELPVFFRNPRSKRGEVGPQPVYRIAGGAEETEEEKAARLKAEADASEKKFTQAELTAKLTDEKRQGERAAARKIMETLGFDTIEEAEKFIKDKREADDKAKTDAQRETDEAKRERAEAAKEKAEAAEEKRTARIERALVRLGAGDDDLDDATLLLAKGLDADAGADDISAAADALKERRPELFAGEVTEPKKKAAELPGGKRGNRKTPDGVKPGAGGLAAAKRRGFPIPGETKD